MSTNKSAALGLSFEAITVEALDALVQSVQQKGMDVLKGEGPAHWQAFVRVMNRSERFRDMCHQHAHLINAQNDCAQGTSGVAMAVIFGYELAISIVESAELSYLYESGVN